MREITFAVYGAAKPAGSKTVGKTKTGRMFVRDASAGSYEWKRQVAQVAGEHMKDWPLLVGPLEVRFVFHVARPKSHYGARGLLPSAPEYPITRPDCLKLARAVEDALTKVVYRDDAQIVTEVLQKRYGERAYVEIHVSETIDAQEAIAA